MVSAVTAMSVLHSGHDLDETEFSFKGVGIVLDIRNRGRKSGMRRARSSTLKSVMSSAGSCFKIDRAVFVEVCALPLIIRLKMGIWRAKRTLKAVSKTTPP